MESCKVCGGAAESGFGGRVLCFRCYVLKGRGYSDEKIREMVKVKK